MEEHGTYASCEKHTHVIPGTPRRAHHQAEVYPDSVIKMKPAGESQSLEASLRTRMSSGQRYQRQLEDPVGVKEANPSGRDRSRRGLTSAGSSTGLNEEHNGARTLG